MESGIPNITKEQKKAWEIIEKIEPASWTALIKKCGLTVSEDELEIFDAKIKGAASTVIFINIGQNATNERSEANKQFKKIKKTISKLKQEMKMNTDMLQFYSKIKVEGEENISLKEIKSKINLFDKKLDAVISYSSSQKGIQKNWGRDDYIQMLAEIFYEYGGKGKLTKIPGENRYKGKLAEFIRSVLVETKQNFYCVESTLFDALRKNSSKNK